MTFADIAAVVSGPPRDVSSAHLPDERPGSGSEGNANVNGDKKNKTTL